MALGKRVMEARKVSGMTQGDLRACLPIGANRCFHG